LVIRFISQLQIVITSSYRAITNSHILQFTTARIKFLSLLYLRRLSPGNGFNIVASSASVFTPLVAGDCLKSHSLLQITNSCWRPSHTNFQLFSLPPENSLVIAAAPRYVALARTAENTDSNSSYLVVCVCCGHYLATAVVYRSIT
jgi:hypothetical protein